MRGLALRIAVVAAVFVAVPEAEAQYSPRIADGREFGAEVTLGDEFVTLAGIFQTAVGLRTDARGGLGISSPDEGDSDVFLTGGLRTILSRGSARFPFHIALDGEIDLLLADETGLGLSVGPSFGGVVGPARALVPYVQPVLVYTNVNDNSETDFGARIGADYEMSETVDLRGSLFVGDDTQLRGAVFFEF